MFKLKSKHLPHTRKSNKQVIEDNADALDPKMLKDLFLFSTFTFVFSALILQFFMTLQTGLLIHAYSISFTYNLFNIGFSSVNADLWPQERILLVYGLGMMVFFGLGMFLLYLLKKRKHLNWKYRLIYTWLAFLMVNSLPMGMLSGIFIFDGFGRAYMWLFNNMMVRLVLAFIALQIAMFYRAFWVNLFLKTAPSASLLSRSTNRKRFLSVVFIRPWALGTLILLIFVLPHLSWSWLIFLLGIGLIVLPVYRNKISKRRYLINKYKDPIFRMPYPLLRFIALIVILWVADFFIHIRL